VKSFNQLTDSEVLNLSNEDLNDSIRLEAIDRGIKPPITLSEALRRSEWRGYTKPAEAIKVWTLKVGYHSSNFGFLDEQLAAKALEGMVCIEENSYTHPKIKITTDIPEIVLKHVGIEASTQKASKFEEFFQDDTEFNKVRDECLERYSKVRQDAYNTRVRQEKRAEYLRLARGNEEIAKSFWAKVESGEWPVADTNGGAQ
jgi:hypothetical protein